MSATPQLELRLVIQGNTAIAHGGVPALADHGDRVSGEVLAACVNFLRCGCPSVQIVSKTSGQHYWVKYSAALSRELDLLELEGETFAFGTKPEDGDTKVITVTREVSDTAE